ARGWPQAQMLQAVRKRRSNIGDTSTCHLPSATTPSVRTGASGNHAPLAPGFSADQKDPAVSSGPVRRYGGARRSDFMQTTSRIVQSEFKAEKSITRRATAPM